MDKIKFFGGFALGDFTFMWKTTGPFCGALRGFSIVAYAF